MLADVTLFGTEIPLKYGHILFVLVAAFIVVFYVYYYAAVSPRRGTTEWIERAVNAPRLNFRFKHHPMERRDYLPMAIITAVFLAVNFLALGDMAAPTTFKRFDTSGDYVKMMMPDAVYVGKLMYYTGLNTGNYKLEYSLDNINWTEVPSADPDKRPTAMEQSHANVFKWRYADVSAPFLACYVKITALDAQLELGELAFYDPEGNLIRVTGEKLLIDEQSLIPDAPSYMNSMYFDEIYHGRTAFETIRGTRLYETVHPPLGKNLISVGITLFGMTPFGWRCVGALFGAGMLAVMYILLKNMFGRTAVAVCGTLLFAFEFMRYTQTRIATVDTYGVFFILAAYLYMYRFVAQEYGTPFRQTLRTLAMSGMMFGLGVASKWIVIYAGAGLFVMYVIKIATDYLYYYRDEGTPGLYLRRFAKLVGFTALFFIAVPLVIYILAYIPLGRSNGLSVGGGMLWNPGYYDSVWRATVNMYKYHAALEATHPYSSTWLQWIIDAKPILYYYDSSMGNGLKSAFSAFTNPLTTWAGLIAVFVLLDRVVRFRDNRALVVLINYFAQLAPWMLITRCVFAYHYFPSQVFLIIAVALLFDVIFERGYKRAKYWVYGFTSLCGLLFVLFYPVLSGMTVSAWYTRNILQWFNSWVF